MTSSRTAADSVIGSLQASGYLSGPMDVSVAQPLAVGWGRIDIDTIDVVASTGDQPQKWTANSVVIDYALRDSPPPVVFENAVGRELEINFLGNGADRPVTVLPGAVMTAGLYATYRFEGTEIWSDTQYLVVPTAGVLRQQTFSCKVGQRARRSAELNMLRNWLLQSAEVATSPGAD